MADSNYGLDWTTWANGATTPDLDPNFTEITGTRAVAEVWARGIIMPHGQLVEIDEAEDARAAGVGLQRYLSARVDRHVLMRIKQACEVEARLDERVDTANVAITFDPAISILKVDGSGTGADGPFRLVLAAGQLTSELLEAA